MQFLYIASILLFSSLVKKCAGIRIVSNGSPEVERLHATSDTSQDMLCQGNSLCQAFILDEADGEGLYIPDEIDKDEFAAMLRTHNAKFPNMKVDFEDMSKFTTTVSQGISSATCSRPVGWMDGWENKNKNVTEIDLRPGYKGGCGKVEGCQEFYICVSPKAGSTAWGNLKDEMLEKHVLQYTARTSNTLHLFKLQQARNPIRRALSGFLYWKGINEHQVEKKGRCTNAQCFIPNTFSEAADQIKSMARNFHWGRQTLLCGKGPYDLIGHIEDRSSWQRQFLDFIGFAQNMNDVEKWVGKPMNDKRNALTVLCDNIDRISFRKLQDYYAKDIEVLGYVADVQKMESEMAENCDSWRK